MAFSFKQTIFSIYVLLLLTCTASFLSHDQECLALFEFKKTFLHQKSSYAFDANHFHKFKSWRMITSNTSDNPLSGSDCCLWDGVVCNNKGHVVELDLSGSSLTGVINSSSTLFKLVHIHMLNLSMNNFSESQIPFEIVCLKQLRSLNLSNSGFSGLIPNEISHLRQLTSLDLSRNPLKLQSLGFEYLSRNMTRLEILRLSGVDLSSSVPRFLANFSSLSYVQLEDCQLPDEFPSAIFLLPKLKHLNIKNNSHLTGSLPGFYNTTLLSFLDLSLTGFNETIPESISNLNLLEVLDLSDCYFSGRIPGSLPNLTQLTYLNLSSNELTGLVPTLASLSKLTIIDLGYNSFETGCVYDWIKKLTMLNKLYLNYMNIHDEILPYLANLTNLSIVSVGWNYISGPIPSSFMNLTQLTKIFLGGNQLHGQISSSFLNFKSLRSLNIVKNNFSGTVSLDSFLGLDNLEQLHLDSNSLSFETTTNHTNGTLPKLQNLSLQSCNVKEFPAFLRYQKNIIELNLANNEIEGLVPNWIWNNSRETLKFIILGDNFITGFHQHPNFLQLVHLEIFDVSYNHIQGQLPIPQTTIIYEVSNNNFSGEIPLWICEMKSLHVLDLSSNNMSGTVPSCLSNLNNSLSVLNLKQNNLHGQVSNICMYGSALKAIELSENQFIGQLSKSLANCTNLEFLSFEENSFEDVFPVWLGTLPKLQVLNMKSNKLYGEIQGLSTTSSHFLMLRIIDISNNNFSGQLPYKLFQSWNAMKYAFNGELSSMGYNITFAGGYLSYYFDYSITLTIKGVKIEYTKILNIFTAIDISCNNFEGQIPQSLQDLHGLESLNLSNNHFTGRISSSFENLKNLESLDISQNELSGQIPKQLLQLSFLAIFNVSFNHLDGRIPQGKQFYTFENNSYLGNPGLCGKPLSEECKDPKILPVLPPTSDNDYESLMPIDGIDWMVISIGFGSGLVIGIAIGNFVYARYDDWFLERFGARKDKCVRPLRNVRRN